MQQFNHESGKIEGKPSYNFYMGGDGSKKSIITPQKDLVDLSGKKLNEMKAEAGVKSDEEYENEIKEVDDYNIALLTPSKEAEAFKFNGNAVVIRLFKHKPFRKIGDLFLDNKILVPFQTEGGKTAWGLSPLQFVHAGVINAISDQCSEPFKNKFKVGDVVHLKMGLNLMQQRCWLNPEDYHNDHFDNWFLINENMIEKGLK